MSKCLEIKDSLYYDDLMYEIRKLDCFAPKADLETEKRIVQRKKSGKISCSLSPFVEELIEILIDMREEAVKELGYCSTTVSDLVVYALSKLVDRKLENEMLIQLISVVKDMRLEHAFSLGEPKEQSVCLNKSDNLWEVYIIERGTSFEKSVYEDCFDACVEVINQLADSKQMYEEAKEKFGMVRKLVPNK